MSLRVLLLLAVLAFSAAAPAKTFRWSSQGDASTVDPHAESEGFTNAIASLVYEALVGYDKNVELTPLLRTTRCSHSP